MLSLPYRMLIERNINTILYLPKQISLLEALTCLARTMAVKEGLEVVDMLKILTDNLEYVLEQFTLEFIYTFYPTKIYKFEDRFKESVGRKIFSAKKTDIIKHYKDKSLSDLTEAIISWATIF